MVEMVERYLDDERMHLAYLGQGVIGTNASPHDPGTASVWFHHASGRMDGHAGDLGLRARAAWGWSPSSCATSRGSSGAVVATGVPVARILPGEGVELASGERIACAAGRSPTPIRAVTLALLAARGRSRPGPSRCARCPIAGDHGEGEHDAVGAAELHRPPRAPASHTTPGR